MQEKCFGVYNIIWRQTQNDNNLKMLITELFCYDYLFASNKIITDMVASQNCVNKKPCWKSFLLERENAVFFSKSIILILDW